jgi:hypothetical protein
MDDGHEACYECGDVFDTETEGDGDICDECVALAEDDTALMHGTISDETRDKVKRDAS